VNSRDIRKLLDDAGIVETGERFEYHSFFEGLGLNSKDAIAVLGALGKARAKDAARAPKAPPKKAR
jgi:hypothetical protein